jgi:hypothetical protein
MMDAAVGLLRARFQQIKKFLVVTEELSNGKHGMPFAPRDRPAKGVIIPSNDGIAKLKLFECET